ncbi:shikimate kinase [Streptomyces sp. Ncost-T6T-1]|uniref:AAA family ATPase n=1 Tax=Streptomyces sp. Ncost-T6T-1 TaxID=1100828 RepID=UPI000804FD09|nr:AAA family ATPase [Streptomyces sp. Ncost-T6T-1]SBU97580.1 shikimate kinase [Streptomyces sp. Ncost-T6T-1]
MAVIFVTGMSGTGKTTALNQLEQRGYKVVDTDVGGWIADLPHPDVACVEPQWREDRIDALITEHEISGEPLFIAGTVWNQGKFYPRFREIVLFSAPLEVMLERITKRDNNPFGKTAEQRDQIVADTAEVEPLLRASATVEINTSQPLAEVVDKLAAFAGPPPNKGHFRYTP